MTKNNASFDDMIGGGDGENLPAVFEEPGALEGISAAPEFSERPDFGAGDLSHPRLRLAQGLTQEVNDGLAKPGDFVLFGFEPEKSVVVVPLRAAHIREMRDHTDDDRPILCSSRDGKRGVGQPGGDCSKCPFTRFSPPSKPGGKNTPPACSEVYPYIFWSVTHDCLVMFNFQRTALSTGRQLNTLLLSKGAGRFAVVLSGKGQQGPRGTYYTPALQVTKVDDEVLELARAAVGAA